MLQDCGFILILAIEIVNCQYKLPVVYLPAETVYYHNPPKLPRLRLPDQKFALPPICTNLPNWEDVNLSLKILSEMTDAKHDTSAFTSLVNLIKFILVKEEMTCDNISIIKENRITNAVTTLENSQILAKIEAALARKPKRKTNIAIVEFNDSIDVKNMIPILRPKSNSTRARNKASLVGSVTTSNSNSTSQPKMQQNLSGLTVVGVKPITSVLGPNLPCQTQCSPTLTLNLSPVSALERQRSPTTCLKPVVLGCQNCNICHKLTTPMLTSCQALSKPVLTSCQALSKPVLTSCQALSNPMLTGYQTLSNAVLTGCQKINSGLANSQKNAVSVLQMETIPLMNCYGNLLKKVTTTILVPYCISKLRF